MDVDEARERLSELIDAALGGETVFIEKRDSDGVRVVRLVPVPPRNEQGQQTVITS